MTDRPKTTRRRKRKATHDEQADTDVSAPPPVTPAASRRVVAKPAEPKPVATSKPAPKLATDDLMALAQMDASELAALMEGSALSRDITPGERVTGVITRIGRADVFVDVGGKAEASIDRRELPQAVVGADVTAMVLTVDEQGIRLSLELSGEAALDHLDDARESGVPVQGKVVSRNKGGFEVKIGTVRAFCPISRISRIQEMDPDGYVGQTLSFRVIETEDKVVLDRRVIQDEEAEARAAELWTTLEVGQELRGVVRSVQPFGFFVDVGGIDGLVPMREFSGTPPAVGVGLDVRVLEIDAGRKRLSLSARASGDDPWSLVGSEFVRGGIYDGAVARVAAFGAFIELAEGLQGLAHVSRFPSGLPAVGEAVRVKIADVDHTRQRLDLAPVRDGAESESDVGSAVTGVVAEVMRNGLVVQLDDGRTGWLPEREVDLPAGTVLAQRFRKGKPVTARLAELGDRRVVLSMREDPAEANRAWRAHAKKDAKTSFGTLGDLLKGLDLKK